MNFNDLVSILGFLPKENSSGIFEKKYAGGYSIEVDFAKNIINYGEKIQADSKTTQNFSQPENLVVLECVNRLLEKGYNPENIILEKTWKLGHQEKGRLDILVTKDDGTAYLMIECKTAGAEFEKELKNTKKNGGQLFTYFQQDTKAELLMLYASENQCKIIKVEDDFRNAGSVQSAFKVWNKKFYEKGFWENPPYDFKNEEIFTKLQLKELTEDKGKKLFNGFATILRKHSVSDKPNAFNVIFNLFLAKLYDEQKRNDDELEFQWKKDDNPVDFQVRLYNLHKEGLNDFLKKEIEGIYDKDFEAKTAEDLYKAKKKLLKFNKLFDIKSVLDDNDFEQNHRVLREVVELLQNYRIRYPRKQKYLSEFFELLLTTGLKQEVGQYFTPPPITKFIIKSIPLPDMIEQEIDNPTPKLPAVIDYAAGSGHFITEILEEYQDIIEKLDTSKYYPKAQKEVASWKADPYNWASKYVYGIEKDYRLVKVAKVGCYFYGDGLAQIVHGDGLDSLTNPPKSYIGLLQQNTNAEDSSKNKFSVVVANPPYSVKYCKEDLEYTGSQNDFTLYPYFTDNSNEIECLFVERTKQLLKDGGVAGVILPSSILSNDGIYTKAREIILQNFEIVAITELGSNTFMATGTNTIVLFLRRRNNSDSIKLKEFIERFFVDFIDNNPPIPFNIIEKPIAKYVNYVWENVNLTDYVSLLKNTPNEKIRTHEFYKTYRKSVEQKIETEIAKARKNRKTAIFDDDIEKIKIRIETEYFNNFVATEKEKLLYFLLAYNQKVVLVNTGSKEAEKLFLGYNFKNRKGNEGIHPMQGKSIDDCTKLYNEKDFEDSEKASTYIYKAFAGDYETEIHESLKNNISRVRLVDMLTFDRENFAKNISTAVKKKVKIESKWEDKQLSDILSVLESGKRPQGGVSEYQSGIPSLGGEHIKLDGTISLENMKFVPENYFNQAKQGILQDSDILICKDGALTGKTALFKTQVFPYEKGMINEHIFILRTNEKCLQQYLFNVLFSEKGQKLLKLNVTGTAQGGLNRENLLNIKIPLPPLEIQQKIVSEIEILEKKENEAKGKIESLREKIEQSFRELDNNANKTLRLSDTDIFDISIGKRVLSDEVNSKGIPVFSANVFDPFGYIDKYLITDFSIPSVLWGIDGDWLVNYMPAEKPFYPTDHCGVLRVKDNEVLPKYLTWLLNEEGKKIGFSRTLRASIDRIQGISVKVSPLSEQQKIVSEIEKIETQIAELEQSLKEIPNKKQIILKENL